MISDHGEHLTRSRYFYALGLLLLSSLLWASVEVLGELLPPGTSPYQTVWMRYFTHLLFMLVVFGPRFRTRLVRTSRLKLQLFRSLLMLGMPFFYIQAILSAHMTLKNVNAIFWIAPLLVIGLAVFILREPVSPNRWFATLIACGGAMILLRPDRGIITINALLPLGMALCFSLYRVLTRELRTDNSITNLFYTAFGVFFPLTLLIPLFWQSLTLETLMPMVTIGLVGFAALFFVDKAYEAAPASVLAPFIYSELICYVVLRLFLGHYLPLGSSLLGATILFAACLYLVYSDTRNMPRHAPLPVSGSAAGN
ncbi:MAG: DMT family transporter [Anaerolineae bacterium]|nr:DMT family transporter [Anaerolineae bacterium]